MKIDNLLNPSFLLRLPQVIVVRYSILIIADFIWFNIL